ncbi:MAG TPA: RsmB/NOP family class I SAM-dependent RNA methyltransferase [Candidatus Magasanikbacteria bacterium]|mgnify:CR=1 FL=1|nr:RsmB/NOP family class I SAM-dependent RNA methyltransferase [Candidatus Magasanikbacteria bacterium]
MSSLGARKATLSEDFVVRLKEIFGSDFARVEKTFINRSTTFRLNPINKGDQEVLSSLRSNGFKLKNVPWSREAYIVENKSLLDLQKTEAYEAGKIYVQSLASMLPAIILSPREGERVLDLAAAPGGKTSLVAAVMKCRGELVACDNNPIRAERLKYNLKKLGVLEEKTSWKCRVEEGDGVDTIKKYQNYFDRVLLDAPCGAESRIVLGDKRTYGFWNERNIKDNAFFQRRLLFAAWSALRPGGTLVYSTCTFAPEENELQIERFLEEAPDAEVIPVGEIRGIARANIVSRWKDKKIRESIRKNALRIIPTGEMEGFFVCKIRKAEAG